MIFPQPPSLNADLEEVRRWAIALAPILQRMSFADSLAGGGGGGGDTNVSLTLFPLGSTLPWFSTSTPEGWRDCDGSLLDRALFPDLYELLGVAWNVGGEDDTNFRLPNLIGRGVRGVSALGTPYEGADEVSITQANLPDADLPVTDGGHTHGLTMTPHGHTVSDPGHVHAGGVSGAGTVEGTTGALGGNTGSATTGITIGQTTAVGTISSKKTGITVRTGGSGTPLTVVPKSARVRWIMKVI